MDINDTHFSQSRSLKSTLGALGHARYGILGRSAAIGEEQLLSSMVLRIGCYYATRLFHGRPGTRGDLISSRA